MNKAELIAKVAETSGFTKKDVDKVTNAVFEAITEALAAGNKVQWVGFGSFEVRQRAARPGRNPRTKEVITIEAAKVPVFKAGKALKDTVNN